MLPFEIIYCRKPDRDIRSSLVAIPVFFPNGRIKVKKLREIVGNCVTAYRLTIPFHERNLRINELEVRMLLHQIHRMVGRLFNEKFPWKGITNVYVKDIKQEFKTLKIRSRGIIQKSINSFFQSFQSTDNPDIIHNPHIEYEIPLSLRPISSIHDEYGYNYFTLYLNGEVEAGVTIGSSATSVKQIAAVPLSINRIKISDPRLICMDSLVRSRLEQLLDDYCERHHHLSLHISFPWLKDFLLVYLSRCLQTIRVDFLQCLNEKQYERYSDQSTQLELIQQYYKPNTAAFKDCLQETRKQILTQGIGSKESKLSQIIQLILHHLDAIPINRSEAFLFNGEINTATSTSNFTGSSSDFVKIKEKRKRKHDGTMKGKHTIQVEDDKVNYDQFLGNRVGDEDHLLSNQTCKKLKFAHLLAASKKAHFNHTNPVRSFRKNEDAANSKKRSSFSNYYQSLGQKISSNKKTVISGSNCFESNPGDGLSDTIVAMNNLFGLHPSAIATLSPSVKLPTRLIFPAEKTMNWIRELVSDKLSIRGPASSTSFASIQNSYDYFHQLFDSSALATIAIFIEESIQEFLLLWHQNDRPLLFSKQALSAEVYSQLNGSIHWKEIDQFPLQTRLEMLFGRSLQDYSSLLIEKKNEFIKQYETTFAQFLSSSQQLKLNCTDTSINCVSEATVQSILAEDRRTISVREKDVEEIGSSFPILSDSKRQIQGEKRTDFTNFPQYLFPQNQNLHQKKDVPDFSSISTAAKENLLQYPSDDEEDSGDDSDSVDSRTYIPPKWERRAFNTPS